MDAERAAEVEDELRKALEAEGLGWVVAQVDETIGEQRLEIIDDYAAAERGGKVESLAQGRAAKRKRERTRPYTPQERAELLVEAVRQAVIIVDRIDGYVGDVLGGINAERARFAAEPDQPRDGWVPRPRHGSRERTAGLEPVLEVLRAEVRE